MCVPSRAASIIRPGSSVTTSKRRTIAQAKIHRMPPLSLVEFPADDPERARRFWAGLLDIELEPRRPREGDGWQTHSGGAAIGVHSRGRGPGDSFSLPYFEVSDIAATVERVKQLGGSVVHPGDAWAICKDSEGNPFGLAAADHPLTST
jgi:predicted enzyme related to lactoylglutathione lyase